MTNQISLFEETKKPTNVPLAEKIRPHELEQIYGQHKLLEEGSQLRNMIENDIYSSFILWGPPGTGKTTIARVIESKTSHRFISFSAVLSSIKDVKAVMKEAEYNLKAHNKGTILFIDEIHRFNKSQQDAFLHYIESGAVILIGATTENPSFEVISALLSRCNVFVLQQLSDEDIIKIIQRALEALSVDVKFEEKTLPYLAELCGGDARKALNYLEIILQNIKEEKLIDVKFISKILSRKAMFYDKDREEHYNVISALHKSLRGSDPQAGLYWLARMLEAGEDPLYVARRLVRFASEDVGLTDPNALVQAIAVKDTCHFLGMPEANVALAQLVVYLATAPKSNALYSAYKKAASDAQKTSHLGVPLHIRNAPTKLMKNLDYGKNYTYDHMHENAYNYQKYFPDKMAEKSYYQPSKFGYEKEIQKRLDWWKKLRDEQENN
ncbi:MAG: replication-associated recombination protein A [Candidatus Cloacimonetes bacterium]|nr:replication-associated recombination protein A [Candidatus Cloacimonadota bacterium]MCF7814056.1 replication-associated recombination protein A [Candidatus Cloacimonadota bacterium]MCF7868642.1 replication-associated recombination protein A [Candidatus Cloacimonadota bacterium]MCF7884097.1 replication-associated recombination protein A [Candidatus Cloacimonadota bacterium]